MTWRIQAKHSTVCPRCHSYIKKGSWIVQYDGETGWSHAVCPGFDTRRPERTDEERAIRVETFRFTEEGIA